MRFKDGNGRGLSDDEILIFMEALDERKVTHAAFTRWVFWGKRYIGKEAWQLLEGFIHGGVIAQSFDFSGDGDLTANFRSFWAVYQEHGRPYAIADATYQDLRRSAIRYYVRERFIADLEFLRWFAAREFLKYSGMNYPLDAPPDPHPYLHPVESVSRDPVSAEILHLGMP
jgi:hypothetical protein